MTKPYVMTLALPEHTSSVVRLLTERAAWLRERGSDQWNTGQSFDDVAGNAVAQGKTWVLLDDGAVIATLAITSHGDTDFWTPEELKDQALYVGKMATSLERSGQGIGRLLLSWARDWAARAGFTVLRWDAWRTNEKLQEYYRSLGARYIRTEYVKHRWSGALFEIDAAELPELATEVVTI